MVLFNNKIILPSTYSNILKFMLNFQQIINYYSFVFNIHNFYRTTHLNFDIIFSRIIIRAYKKKHISKHLCFNSPE